MERQEARHRVADEQRIAILAAPSRYHRGVKRAFASIAGLVGLAALGRWLAKRRHPAASRSPSRSRRRRPQRRTAADPAEELRRKLADARVAEPDVAAARRSRREETLDERRARVHAKAREAIDSMAATTGDGGTAS